MPGEESGTFEVGACPFPHLSELVTILSGPFLNDGVFVPEFKYQNMCKAALDSETALDTQHRSMA